MFWLVVAIVVLIIIFFITVTSMINHYEEIILSYRSDLQDLRERSAWIENDNIQLAKKNMEYQLKDSKNDLRNS